MRKLLNKPWFVATLAILALAFVGHSLMPQNIMRQNFTNSAQNPRNAEEMTEAPALTENAPNQKIDWSSPNLFPFKRDPFTPSVRLAAQRTAAEQIIPDIVETVHLSAIWAQSGAIFVLINGKIQQPGDEIGRLKIDSASTDGVWLTHWKGRDHLSLGANFTLNTPAAIANSSSPTL